MAYEARIEADSIGPHGVRLTTFVVTFPRIILAEVNTHRMLSRNSASSRAIPVEKQIRKVLEDPFIPVSWGKNGRGMQAKEELDERAAEIARASWLASARLAVEQAQELLALGVHKQITNRLLEPFLWHTCIITATEWENFFALRCHPDAQPEFQVIARMMRDLYSAHVPTQIAFGEWHLPFSDDFEPNGFRLDSFPDGHYPIVAKVSAGRCARVSYELHDGGRSMDEDCRMAHNLERAGHMSPFEHPAECIPASGEVAFNSFGSPLGNFRGFRQLRKFLPGERVFVPREA